jgi:hypothetical protein
MPFVKTDKFSLIQPLKPGRYGSKDFNRGNTGFLEE